MCAWRRSRLRREPLSSLPAPSVVSQRRQRALPLPPTAAVVSCCCRHCCCCCSSGALPCSPVFISRYNLALAGAREIRPQPREAPLASFVCAVCVYSDFIALSGSSRKGHLRAKPLGAKRPTLCVKEGRPYCTPRASSRPAATLVPRSFDRWTLGGHDAHRPEAIVTTTRVSC